MPLDTSKPETGSSLASQPVRDNFQALEEFVEPEHNTDGTHKYALDKRGDTSTGDQTISKSTPALRLIGGEAQGKDVRLVESAGDFIIQKNTGTEGTPVWVTMFSIDGDTFALGAANINETNLVDGTEIPDTKLSTIAAAGKVSDTALSSNIPNKNATNTFSAPQIIQHSGSAMLQLLDNADATYKVYLHKTATTGEFSISIRDKSTSGEVAYYNFSHTEFLSEKSIRTLAQLRSSVATGTAPLTVASTTKVTNLNADLLDNYHVMNFGSLSITTTNYYNCSRDGGYSLNPPQGSFTPQTHLWSLARTTVAKKWEADTWAGGITYINAYINYSDSYYDYHNYHDYSDYNDSD